MSNKFRITKTQIPFCKLDELKFEFYLSFELWHLEFQNIMLDIILAIFLLLGFLLGLKDGLLKKIFTLIAVLLGIFLSYRFFRFGSAYLMNNAHFSPQLAVITSFLVIFLAVYILIRLIYRFFEPDKPKYSVLNRILGGIVGLVQAAIVASFLLLAASFFQFPNEEMKETSKLYTPLLNIAPQMIDITSSVIPRSTKEAIQDSLQEHKPLKIEN